MRALRLYAGPKAMAHIREHGLRPEHIGVIPGAAGGPKGLILGPLDSFLFSEWLPQSQQPIDLVGASIGAWRMATACLNEPAAGFNRLSHDYIHQHYVVPEGQRRLTARQVSEEFNRSLDAFYNGRVDEILNHSRYRLHVVTSRGRHILRREHALATPFGYASAYLFNVLHRPAMGAWLERVVFSSGQGNRPGLPFSTNDFRTRQVLLDPKNFMAALQASCAIPFVLQAVHDIPGAPRGAYWDGGITDYHLHLNYTPNKASPIVLYPHFQQAVVPGWLDKALKWRHKATSCLDHALILAPDPEWVKTLPNGKLPDRADFTRYQKDSATRIAVWQRAVAESQRLVDEFTDWVKNPSISLLNPLT